MSTDLKQGIPQCCFCPGECPVAASASFSDEDYVIILFLGHRIESPNTVETPSLIDGEQTKGEDLYFRLLEIPRHKSLTLKVNSLRVHSTADMSNLSIQLR